MKIKKHSKKVERKKRTVINISGTIFETYESTLARFPTTLLANKQDRLKYFCKTTGQYFFESNPVSFESILFFYQSYGTLNCPMGMPINMFESECKVFRIPRTFIDSMLRSEGIFPDLLEGRGEVGGGEVNESFRSRMWNLLENPNTSRSAWKFGMFSMAIVLLSIATASAETVQVFILWLRQSFLEQVG